MKKWEKEFKFNFLDKEGCWYKADPEQIIAFIDSVEQQTIETTTKHNLKQLNSFINTFSELGDNSVDLESLEEFKVNVFENKKYIL